MAEKKQKRNKLWRLKGGAPQMAAVQDINSLLEASIAKCELLIELRYKRQGQHRMRIDWLQ